MIYFSNSKKIFLLIICVLGFFLALPNFSKVNFPLLPKQTINLGLDLRGGSYLLLEVDTNSIKSDRSQSLLEDIRSTFRQNKIKYSGLKTNMEVRISGIVRIKGKLVEMIHPEVEIISNKKQIENVVPYYKTKKMVSQNKIRSFIKHAYDYV